MDGISHLLQTSLCAYSSTIARVRVVLDVAEHAGPVPAWKPMQTTMSVLVLVPLVSTHASSRCLHTEMHGVCGRLACKMA